VTARHGDASEEWCVSCLALACCVAAAAQVWGLASSPESIVQPQTADPSPGACQVVMARKPAGVEAQPPGVTHGTSEAGVGPAVCGGRGRGQSPLLSDFLTGSGGPAAATVRSGRRRALAYLARTGRGHRLPGPGPRAALRQPQAGGRGRGGRTAARLGLS
jgi:hypothetical protein